MFPALCKVEQSGFRGSETLNPKPSGRGFRGLGFRLSAGRDSGALRFSGFKV